MELNNEYGTPEDFRKAVVELRNALPAQNTVSTDSAVLKTHGDSRFDYHPESPPTVVAFPNSTEDVVAIVKIALKYKMPIIPYSGATSLEGNFRAPPIGGICVDLSRMNKILEIHEADSDVVCQPGVQWTHLNDALKEKGIRLFFPLDPGYGATIGGMISTGCSGTNAVCYGTAKGEWILNITVVLPNGQVMKTRQRSRKSSAGFDSTKLFIGAEGTLGIITEATLRLAPVLDTNVAVVSFPDARSASNAVIEVMNRGVGAQCIELVDDVFMHAVNASGLYEQKWPETDSLFIKFQGSTARAIQEGSDIAREVMTKHGAIAFELAKNEQEATDLWNIRKNALHAGLKLVPGARGWSTDVCVPVSRLPEIITETKKDIAKTTITSVVIGHAGDGNFHTLLLFRDDAELEVARQLADRMAERAIALEGTCTGEHGVGIGKRKYLKQELGEGTIDFMKTIKRAIDPLNLFNPGKASIQVIMLFD
ncbi:uncharacterized protein LAESUDRAFT_765110 [Laetiporus sulphureus 93-53]|uniref:D-lactate dehydrogenase (cytochrome) n=1 Tax=Laetiporus sulphureus 93-53 TaxID=1314785 RepID=A0A165AYH7_9APHY|nr:uncharacterized protein LAESUDRAFT_765110 [Laetiporus sulphureus 93-53]KZS99897.1 hypothetical protein LAESUDRAFT_765110 [Laetiporus sulphureus 93-53]